MKRFFIMLMMVCSILGMQASEVSKYRAHNVSFSYCVNGVWSDWTSPETANVLISTTETMIGINSSKPQFYTIRVSTYCEQIDSNFTYRTWLATDSNGLTVKISLVSKSEYLFYVVIEYNDFKILYDLT